MALTKNITLNIFGKDVEFDATYIKITNVNGNKNIISIQVTTFDSGENNVLTQNFYNYVPTIDDSSTNFIKQGYIHLKTLDEFKAATDC